MRLHGFRPRVAECVFFAARFCFLAKGLVAIARLCLKASVLKRAIGARVARFSFQVQMP